MGMGMGMGSRERGMGNGEWENESGKLKMEDEKREDSEESVLLQKPLLKSRGKKILFPTFRTL